MVLYLIKLCNLAAIFGPDTTDKEQRRNWHLIHQTSMTPITKTIFVMNKKFSPAENKMTHEDYKECLFGRKYKLTKMNIIHSCAHKIYAETINKVAVSSENDKIIILEDGIHTLAHGHFKLSQLNLFACLGPNQRSGR